MHCDAFVISLFFFTSEVCQNIVHCANLSKLDLLFNSVSTVSGNQTKKNPHVALILAYLIEYEYNVGIVTNNSRLNLTSNFWSLSVRSPSLRVADTRPSECFECGFRMMCFQKHSILQSRDLLFYR